MTTVTTSARTYTEHRFEIPTGAYGAAVPDLGTALNLANRKADEIGIDKTYDDWCRVVAEDEAVVLIVKERHPEVTR